MSLELRGASWLVFMLPVSVFVSEVHLKFSLELAGLVIQVVFILENVLVRFHCFPAHWIVKDR